MDASLERIRRATSILDTFTLTEELLASAASSTDPSRDCRALVEAIQDAADAPTAIAAAHALGRLAGTEPDERLAELLDPDEGWLAPHAAWALARRPPRVALVAPLVELVAAGRLRGMLAQRTLGRWALDLPVPVTRALAARLEKDPSPAAGARLVETLGLARGPGSLLAGIAADATRSTEVRVAALAALGDRPEAPRPVVEAAARADGPVANVARLALLDHVLQATPGQRPRPGDGALRLAQVHMGGRLDATLMHVGEGDTGGIATLLVQLGDALARDGRVQAVTTIGHGPAAEMLASIEAPRAAGAVHAVMPVPLDRHEGSSFVDPWPALVTAERGLRRILRLRPVTVLHLRMADVGSLAAARIARTEGLPIVFTLAPDPHAVIAEMERSGELDRASFGPADARGSLWFRAWLVARLTRGARQVVLFPRPELAAGLRDLVGIDVDADPGRYHVIPEGVDLVPVRTARADAAGALAAVAAADAAPARAEGRRVVADRPPAVLADLRDAIAALGAGRLGLPIVVSVGRLIEMKGMARIAEAFASDQDLRHRANLVIVGGDLDDPSPAERAEIDRIEAVFVDHPELAEALVMLGHRPHDDVLRVLAVTRHGLTPWIAPGGAYVCGSRKEEFGLAIVEALATGLPVVAPRAGGPASYVEDGITGRLVDTLDRRALVAGIQGALDLVEAPGRARRAELLVEERFTIRAMAEALVPIYTIAERAGTSALADASAIGGVART